MALTNEDLQAISGLLDVKLQPINSQLEGVERRLGKVEGRLGKVEDRLDKVEGRLDKVENRLDKLESEMSGLKIGQAEIRTHIKQLDQKISKTYELALDAWGIGMENRTWLEQRKHKSPASRRVVSRKVKA